MEQRDFIKDEIERIGQAIGRLIAQLIGTDGNNLPPAQWRATISEALTEDLGLSLDQLLDHSRESLLELVDERQLTPAHIEQLGDLFAEWAGTEREMAVRINLGKRALMLYGLSGELSANFSFTRAKKEAHLVAFLKNEET